jgi:transcriptional regulator with XRE-family HTH domain
MRGLSLQQVAEHTKLSPRVLWHIEHGDFAALPAGLPGRAHVRAYARAVGLDPEEMVAALGDRVPPAPDPLEALRAQVRQRFAARHPHAAWLQERVDAVRRRTVGVLRVSVAGRGAVAHTWQHAVSIAIDAAMLIAISIGTLVVAAWLTGARVFELLHAARWPLAVSCGLATTLYFVIARSLGGRSTGTVIAAWLTRALEHRHAASAARGHAS